MNIKLLILNCKKCRSNNHIKPTFNNEIIIVNNKEFNHEIIIVNNKEILVLDLLDLDYIASFNEINTYNIVFNNIDDIKYQLLYLFTTINFFTKKYLNKQLSLSKLTLRLIKFKLLFITYINKTTKASSNSAKDIAYNEINIINVTFLFEHVKNNINSHDFKLMQNTYINYFEKVSITYPKYILYD